MCDCDMCREANEHHPIAKSRYRRHMVTPPRGLSSHRLLLYEAKHISQMNKLDLKYKEQSLIRPDKCIVNSSISVKCNCVVLKNKSMIRVSSDSLLVKNKMPISAVSSGKRSINRSQSDEFNSSDIIGMRSSQVNSIIDQLNSVRVNRVKNDSSEKQSNNLTIISKTNSLYNHNKSVISGQSANDKNYSGFAENNLKLNYINDKSSNWLNYQNLYSLYNIRSALQWWRRRGSSLMVRVSMYFLVWLLLAGSVAGSEFPDRECCDSVPPPPPNYHHATSTSTSTTPSPRANNNATGKYS